MALGSNCRRMHHCRHLLPLPGEKARGVEQVHQVGLLHRIRHHPLISGEVGGRRWPIFFMLTKIHGYYRATGAGFDQGPGRVRDQRVQ